MPRQKTTEEFIGDAYCKHGDKYNYKLVDYKNNKTKVKIICHNHGIFEQKPSNHLNGQNCPKCGLLSRASKRRKISDGFILESYCKHPDKYNYRLVDYKNNKTKVKIICPIHGIFEQRPYNHIKGEGCLECCGSKQKTTQEFIIDAYCKHPDKYNYRLVDYKNSKTKVKIICPDCGVFEQKANNHLNGQGCPKCAKRVSKQEIDFRDYIKTIYKDELKFNDRSLIDPYELDLILPDLKLAIEYNGDYWHQEGLTKPYGYHDMKTKMCNHKGYDLLFVWETEWLTQKNKIKNKIKEIIQYEKII